MASFEKALSVVTRFLTEAQSIGLIKEFTVAQSENLTEESCHSHQLISTLVNELNKIKAPQEDIDASMQIDVVNETTDFTSSSKKMSVATPEKNLVQIQANETEIKRRISAFISRKRKEVDGKNVQDFCSHPYLDDQNPLWEDIDSCARVDAIFVHRPGCKSRVKVSKVDNRWGPQTQLQTDIKQFKTEPEEENDDQLNKASLQAIEERIQDMEYHLKLKMGSRTSIFRRLKNLEDRILYLEGISPDYFNNIPVNRGDIDYQSPKKKFHHSAKDKYSSWSLDDVQKRIQKLRETLKTKSKNY